MNVILWIGVGICVVSLLYATYQGILNAMHESGGFVPMDLPWFLELFKYPVYIVLFFVKTTQCWMLLAAGLAIVVMSMSW